MAHFIQLLLHHGLLIASLVLLCRMYPCNAQNTCSRVGSSNCRCQYDDAEGTIIDFSPIGLQSGKPKFDFGTYGTQTDFHYAFNPCFPFSAGDCKDVAACQKYTPSSTTFDVGDPNPSVWSSTSNSILAVYSSTTAGVTRDSHVTYTCDDTAFEPTLHFSGELIPPGNQYDFEVKTCIVCRPHVAGCPRPSSGGGGGITIGGILCIVFIVMVVIYIVGGVLLQKYYRGAQGVEMVPNYGFWSDFPALVKDGFMLMISPCRRGGYSEMT